ncbi:trypsin, alkaline C-like [Anticarsia gemmatalis]|uniref:trypsin, alkaline C-like n=1 Tax=Anticarsia gemmatalis TaxID=129554 RepID=UPI003F764419
MSAIKLAVTLLAGLTCVLALGEQATIAEFPSIVQVEDRVGAIWLQQCVGSVLTSYHILSAASCFSDVQYSARNRRVRAGTSYRGVDGLVREVYAVYNHPTYATPGMGQDGDISVVRLTTPLTLGATIEQASILGEGIYLPPGLEVTLAGWGTTAEGGLVGDEHLYSLDLVTIDDDRCLETYLGASTPHTITENMFCTGLATGGRDLDSRDAGAPLFYSGVTVGVVSFGVSRGEDQYPVVATAIGSYTNWIVDTASRL